MEKVAIKVQGNSYESSPVIVDGKLSTTTTTGYNYSL